MFKLWKLSFFLLIFLTGNCAFAQSRTSFCKLRLQNAPRVAGLRLGMTVEEVVRSLNVPFDLEEAKTHTAYSYMDLKTGKIESQATYANVGEKEATIDNRQELFKRNEKLAGIERIDLKFFENRLFDFSIFYEKDTYKFNTIKPFGLALASLYKLPAQSWLWFDNTAYMNCQGFRLTAFNSTSKMTDFSKITPNMKPENINSLPLIDKKFITFSVSDSRIYDQLKEKAAQVGRQERKE